MFIYGVLFLAAVVLLLISTHFIVLLGERISKVLRISPLIVATTIVAIGTSLPELILSVTAVAAGDRGLAIGNVVGSNVLNILLVLPVAILFGNIRVGTKKTQTNALILFATTALFILFQTFHFPNVVSGFIFLVSAGVVSFYEYSLGRRGRMQEDIALFLHKEKAQFLPRHTFMFIVALFWVVLSAITVVFTVEKIAIVTGLSTTVLGLTLTALATSLPEMFVTVSSSSRNSEKIALGNILGSNIYNLLLVAGLINLLSFEYIPLNIEWLFLAVSTVALVGLIRFYKGQVFPKRVGWVLLTLCLVYVWFVFV